MFREYFRDGLSSSLAKVIDEGLQQQFSQEEGRLWPVAVLPLKTLLRSIPPSVDILHIMTDMQGFDLDAIKSAGDEIRRTVLRRQGGVRGRQERLGFGLDGLHEEPGLPPYKWK